MVSSGSRNTQVVDLAETDDERDDAPTAKRARVGESTTVSDFFPAAGVNSAVSLVVSCPGELASAIAQLEG